MTENEHIEIEERGYKDIVKTFLVFKLWQDHDKAPLSHNQLFLSAKTLPLAKAYIREWFPGLPITVTKKAGD